MRVFIWTMRSGCECSGAWMDWVPEGTKKRIGIFLRNEDESQSLSSDVRLPVMRAVGDSSPPSYHCPPVPLFVAFDSGPSRGEEKNLADSPSDVTE